MKYGEILKMTEEEKKYEGSIMTEEERKYYREVIYPKIVKRDMEKAIYKECDEEDRLKNLMKNKTKIKLSMNLNDTVQIKLTSYGWETLHKYYNEFKKQEGISEDNLEWLKKGYNCGEGYYSFHLWEVMLIFGKDMWMGNDAMPFDMNIIITGE